MNLQRPSTLIIDEHSHIWLADSGNQRILGATRTGRVHTIVAGAGLIAPHGLALARAASTNASATLYIADAEQCQIWCVELDPFDSLASSVASQPRSLQPRVIAGIGGNATSFLPDGQATEVALPRPSGIAIDDDARRLYIAFAEIPTVAVFDLDTGFIRALSFTAATPATEPALALQRPRGIALAPDRTRLYIADEQASAVFCVDLRAQVMTTLAAGKPSAADKTPAAGNQQALAPRDIAVSPAGLIVTDSNAHSLRGINLRHGTVVTIWQARDEHALRQPIGLGFDRHDRSYVVADSDNHRLLRIARDAASAAPLSLTF